jgi:hypothetical protein
MVKLVKPALFRSIIVHSSTTGRETISVEKFADFDDWDDSEDEG